MKTEDFDDAIRRKLASLDHPTNKSDVASVLRYVRKNSGSFFNRNKYKVYLAAASLCIASLVTFSVFQKLKHKELEKTIHQLKSDLQMAQNKTQEPISVATAPASLAPTSIVAKGKTEKNIAPIVELTKSTQAKSTHTEAGQTYSTAENQKEKPEVQYTKSSGIHSYQTSVQSVTSNFSDKTGEVNLPPSGPVSKYESGAPVEINNSANSANVLSPPTLSQNTSTTKMSNENQLSVASDPEYGNETNEIPLKEDTIINKNKLLKQNETPSENSSGENAASKLPFQKNWQYRVGIGFEAGVSHLAAGLMADMIYKNNWSFSAGLKWLKNGEESFDNDDDYSHNKKNEFKHDYSNQVKDETHHDIRIRNTVYQLPVSLGYIQPLKKNFSLIYNLGTDIDLSVKEKVAYRHVSSTNDLQGQSFVANCKPVYFNNVVVSAGLQKMVHSFVFQFSPYLSPQIIKVDYKSNLYYGLRLRALYKF